MAEAIAAAYGPSFASITLDPECMAGAYDQSYAYFYPIGTERAVVEAVAVPVAEQGAGVTITEGPVDGTRDLALYVEWHWTLDAIWPPPATDEQREAIEKWLSHAKQDEFAFRVQFIFDDRDKLVDRNVAFLQQGDWVLFADRGQFDDPERAQAISEAQIDYMAMTDTMRGADAAN